MLTLGRSFAGLLVDGVDSTPWTGATLKFEAPHGVVVEVPYVHRGDSDQFAHVDGWFETQSPPQNLFLETPEGIVGLYGIRWRGHVVGSGASLGKLAPRETLLGRCEAPLGDPLVVSEVHSRIDGLREWTQMKSIEFTPETDEQGLANGLTVNVRSLEGEAWGQGDATVQFRSDWRTSRPDDTVEAGLNIADGTVLVTKFTTPRPFTDHLVEQRKVVNLLTLVSGQPVHFRQHKVSAESIVSRSVGGTILSNPRVQLISADTVRDYGQPTLSKDDLNRFLAHLPEVGTAGMMRWAEQHDRWKRFILPAVGVLRRKGAYSEDVIISMSMSMEAAGQIIGERDGEEATHNRSRPTTATYVYRCLHLLGVKWGDVVANDIALARAIAKAYNDIKHFDRGEFPEPDVSHLISVIARYIVRLLALHLVDGTGALLVPFREEQALWRVQRYHEAYGLSFAEDGTAKRTTLATDDEV